MKKLKIFFAFFMISHLAFGQNWQWAKKIGGTDVEIGSAKLDANNSIYCSGWFRNNCYFDNDTLFSLGYDDLFLAKYDASGNELWAKRFGGNNPFNSNEYVTDYLIDNASNCLYYTGTFYGTLNIDSYSVISGGGLDMFLAKFDFAGNCLWLKKAGSISDDRPATVSLDALGNIFWTGVLANNGFFETSSLDKGVFLSKIDTNGNLIWARNEITGGYATQIKIIDNYMILSGVAENDTTVIDTANLISQHIGGIFLVKLDTTGNFISGRKFESNLASFITGFELDGSNNIYAVGQFTDSLIIDVDTLTNNAIADMFFAKFDNNYNLVWVNQSHANGAYGANIGSITKDFDDNFYLAGYFGGNATFGTFNINSSITKDMFLARYDQNGDCIGIRHFGEAESGQVNVDSNGDLIVSGNFIGSVNIGSTTLSSSGLIDIFFAKSDAITGIGDREIDPKNSLIIYANPNAGKCNITVPDDFVHEKNLTLSIFDNTGKLIQQKTLEMNDGKIKISLEEESKGIYNVTLSNKKKSYNGKIVFE